MGTGKTSLIAILCMLAGLWGCGSTSPLQGGGGSGGGGLGGGGNSTGSSIQISPASAIVGSADLTLTIEGTDFDGVGVVQTAVVWSVNGKQIFLTSTILSSTQLTAVVPSNLMQSAVKAQVFVERWDKIEQVASDPSLPAPFTVVSASSSRNPPGFAPTGSMSFSRSGHTATLLLNGTVLVAGGGEPSAELFDPVTGNFTTTGSMSVVRSGATATRTSDGRVLITGGSDSAGTSLASAELFDPAVGRFSSVSEMTTPRSGATATLLLDGKVLIAGGVDNNNQILDTAELFDPATGTFTPTAGIMTYARWGHTASLLPTGKVLVVGGRVSFAPNLNSNSGEVFDPSTGIFTTTGLMATRRNFHTATVLPSGKVLILGGNASLFSLSSGELYDSISNNFAPLGNLQTARESHTATLLPTGKVLVIGGIDWFPGPDSPEATPLAKVELFDPNSAISTLTSALSSARRGHTATLLPDGSVLVVGGVDGSGNVLATAEVYR